jgi:hypothetical protein
MSSNIKNRSFLGAIAEAIKTFCLFFVSGINVANDAVSMADKAVFHARKKQAADLGISMDAYAAQAQLRASVEQVQAQEALLKFIEEDPSDKRRKMIAETHARLKSIVDRELAMLDSERAARS